jgi:tetratricopeptide (TPR) repeat protein
MKRQNRKTRHHPKSAGGSGAKLAPPSILPSSLKRRRVFRWTAMTLVPLLLLVALELVLRVGGYGYDPDFFKRQQIAGEDFLVQNDDFSRRFFPAEVIRHPSALRMRAQKSSGSIRVFVLGESAAMGDPEPAFGPARYLEVLLRQRHPTNDFEIVNVAFTAINSHVLLPLARECAKYEGDLWIVYMGNNEMVGPFGAATVFGAQSPPRSYVRLSLALQRTRVGQLGRALSDHWRKRGTDASSWGGMQMFLENKVAPDSPQRAAAYRNFAGNLNDIVAAGRQSGARVILNTVAVNLRESPPFASHENEHLSSEVRDRLNAAIAQGRNSEATGAWGEAAAWFAQATELDGQHAEAHYRRAVCLQQLGDLPGARTDFQLACDLDALPFRADSQINEAIRQTVAQQADPALQLLDVADVLARQSGFDLCGEETFYEHVHFNCDGGYRLGLAWAAAVEQSGLLGSLGKPTGPWASQEACERALGLTDWNRKLMLESMFRRIQQPPLSSQFNNATRTQRLRERERKLLSGMNTNTAAAARAAYQAAIAAHPEDHFLYEAYGNFLQLTGDLPGAIEQWRSTADLLPHDFLPWFQIGVLSSRHRQFAEAQKNLRVALRLRPGLVEGWMELARSLGEEQQWEPALDAYQRALRLRPQDPMIWVSQGQALAQGGRREAAVESFRQALRLAPSHPIALESLQKLQLATGSP